MWSRAQVSHLARGSVVVGDRCSPPPNSWFHVDLIANKPEAPITCVYTYAMVVLCSELYLAAQQGLRLG